MGIPYLVELCAGSASVTLGLLGGRPPVTYLGSKTGYREAIYRILGLQAGQGADRVLLVEAGQWADVWRVLVSPENRTQIVEILKGWNSTDDRELWMKLKEEWRSSPVWEGSPMEAARWLWLTHRSFGGKGPTSGFDTHHRSDSAAGLARRVEALPDWPADTTILRADVAGIEPGELPSGTVVYFDPPYAASSKGYKAKLRREQVLQVARRWSDAGAIVCVSEAEPLDLGEGWHHVEITGCRVGSRRTFSVQQREWLTLNKEPCWVPESASLIEDLFAVPSPHPILPAPLT